MSDKAKTTNYGACTCGMCKAKREAQVEEKARACALRLEGAEAMKAATREWLLDFSRKSVNYRMADIVDGLDRLSARTVVENLK